MVIVLCSMRENHIAISHAMPPCLVPEVSKIMIFVTNVVKFIVLIILSPLLIISVIVMAITITHSINSSIITILLFSSS